MPKGRYERDPLRRFESLIRKDENGCWLWLGRIDDKGYGRVTRNYKVVKAHRWAYEFFVGPIPEGLVIDHLCRVRHCVNPNHLEAVTNAENIRRGIARCAKVTHCSKGHEFTPENTKYSGKKRQRVCRICRRAYISQLRKRRWLQDPEWRAGIIARNERNRQRRKLA